MKRIIISFIFFLFIIQASSAQSLKVYLGLGGLYNNFQDTRFSDMQFTKFTIQPEIGITSISKKNLYLGYINAHFYNGINPATDSMKYSTAQLDFRFGYMREIKSGLFIGGVWDILNYSFYQQQDLDNSNNTYLSSSDLFFTTNYSFNFNKNWKLSVGGDIGVFSLLKFAPSFTANFQQNVVDNGNVSFENPESRNPLSFSYIEVKPFWEQLYLRSNIEVFFKRRLSMAYLWSMRTIWEQKGYPVTQAMHTITLRFHFISLPKNK